MEFKKNTAEIYAIAIKPPDRDPDPRMENDIKCIIRELYDVCPEKLPKDLPSHREKRTRNRLYPSFKTAGKGNLSNVSARTRRGPEKYTGKLEQGFVRPCSRSWGPCYTCNDKDDSLRLFLDYRAPNRFTFKNGYRLPRIDELLDALCMAKYFSKVDLFSGYHHPRTG